MNIPLPVRSANRVGVIVFLALVALVVTLGACNPSATPAPSLQASSPAGSAPASVVPSSTTITSPQAAAAVVIGSDPRFAGLTAQDPNAIGQCCFYTVTSAADGYVVTIEVGWGDCQAGCIDRHHWTYSVKTDGTIHLDREDGPPVPAGVPGSSDGTTGGIIGIRGIASAGPVCPVVRPNDPHSLGWQDFRRAQSWVPVKYLALGATVSFTDNFSNSGPAEYDVVTPALVLSARIAF